jgi:hypothetical protein
MGMILCHAVNGGQMSGDIFDCLIRKNTSGAEVENPCIEGMYVSMCPRKYDVLVDKHRLPVCE